MKGSKRSRIFPAAGETFDGAWPHKSTRRSAAGRGSQMSWFWPCQVPCDCGFPLLQRTKLNVVVQVKPWLYLKTLIDCWYIGHTKGQKRVTFPLSLIESVNQSSKFWIKICGFHAQVFDWFSRVFHCLFTGFSRSFHALFTLWVWSGICLKLWSPVYIYTSTHWVW